ncbi:MAG: NADH-quinone oxidoreductase subunit H [Myxococcales bacterium]|nr:NADH-quinone oxidoreductase subunit H [Myxococcales bacterium]
MTGSFTWADLVVALLKIIVVIGFLITLAAVATWGDRRQSAMVQDRIGPQRAVVWLPSLLARVLLGLPAVAVAGLIIVPLMGAPGGPPAQQLQVLFQRTLTGIELAILVGWFTLLVLAATTRASGEGNAFDGAVARLDPRSYFYIGLALHLVAIPLVQIIPPSIAPHAARAAVVLAGVAVLASGLYAAIFRVPSGKVPLRLAGLLHAMADGVKLAWKEDLRPKTADKLLFALAPLISMFPALVTIGVLPFGGNLCFIDRAHNGALDFGDLTAIAANVERSGMCGKGYVSVPLQIADLNIGLLYVFAIAGTGVVGAAIAGWASDNKFALLGALRASSQMVSYEVAMGLSIVGLVVVYGTLQMSGVVGWQGDNAWGIFVQPFGFLLFFAALIAETKRVPFDQPEGESEIVAGYFIEYSGMRFTMFYLGEYAEFAFSSALLVTLFFGGFNLPFLHPDGIDVSFGGTSLLKLQLSHFTVTLLQVVAFFGKTVLVTWLQIFVRWTLPRFRYDQLMKLGWTKLLPLALANIVVTAVVVLALREGGATVKSALRWAADLTQAVVAVGGVAAAVAFIAWLLEPQKTGQFIHSTAARFATAQGGVKPQKLGA